LEPTGYSIIKKNKQLKMKTTKIIFWSSTIIIFLFEGVMPALTGHTEMAKQGIGHLGYPDYFRVMLNVFKIIGATALIIPQIPAKIKEWAYAGLAFSLISASWSIWAVDGFGGAVFFPAIILGILSLSYINRNKLEEMKKAGV
jgi:hypothetical protein